MFEIEGRAGRLPEPPEVLLEVAGNKRMLINYLGPLAEAQKRLSKTRSVEAGMQYITNMANIDPTVVDVVNGDATLKYVLTDGCGFPAQCMNDDETIKDIREIRAKQQDDAQTVESLPKIAKAAASAGKAAQAGSPLMALLEGMGAKAGGGQTGTPG
jgi:hypothetical protein